MFFATYIATFIKENIVMSFAQANISHKIMCNVIYDVILFVVCL